MKPNRRKKLLAFLAIVLIVTITACSNGGSGNAENAKVEVRVIGTARDFSRSAASSNLEFASADVIISDQNVTDQLQTTAQDEGNDVEFSATVEVIVVNSKVEYRVEAKDGFVFDEWEIDRAQLRSEKPENLREILKELNEATEGDNETISIKADYVKYLRPKFERGLYVANPSELANAITLYSSQNQDDDEFTIKIASGNAGALDLNSIIDSTIRNGEDEIELKIIGGYNSSWNVDGRTTFTSITVPQNNNVEIEIEFRNIEFETIDYSNFGMNDFEIEMENCFVGTLSNASGIIANMVIRDLGVVTNATFVNSDVPYDANATYYHSVIRGDNIGAIKGKNNIVVDDPPSVEDPNNLYYPDFGTSYKTTEQNIIETLITADPLSEDALGNLEDYLEEDIEGRDRFLAEDDEYVANISVSFGPYEYIWFED